MAIQTEPTRIQIPFADSGTKNVIPDTNSTPSASQAASWTDGFPAQCSLPLSAGGIPPARADFNGLLNTMTQSERFTQEGGVWEWDATVDYAANRMALGSDGKLYWSIAQSGPNVGGAQDPTTDTSHTYWQPMPLDDSNVVHISGTENIIGEKYFQTALVRDGRLYGHDNIHVALVNGVIEKGVVPASSLLFSFALYDKTYPHPGNPGDSTTPKTLAAFGFQVTSGGDAFAFMRCNYFTADSTNYQSVNLCETDKTFYPGQSGVLSLGRSGNKWTQVWATTGTIQTSDERKKQQIETIPDEVLDAWGEIGFVQFKFNDAADAKGAEQARLHSGLIAQRIDEAFKSRGLDPRVYGFFCHDDLPAMAEERDEDGIVIVEARAASDEYALRYEEALCMEAAYQRRRADRAEARLVALEERLAAIEARLNA